MIGPRAPGALDVAIIGGGPAGLAAGAQAARRGLAHVVLERGDLAQTVVWYQKRKLVMAEPGDLPLHAGHPLSFEEGPREAVLEAWMQGTEAAGTHVQSGPANEVVRIDGERGGFELVLKDDRRITAGAVVQIGRASCRERV